MKIPYTATRKTKKDLESRSLQGVKKPTAPCPVRPRLLPLKDPAVYMGRSVHSMRVLVDQRVFPVVQLGNRSKIWLDRQDPDAY